jgi:tellurite resistance protein TerC
MNVLFPFDQYWWFYSAFTLGVLVLVTLDLGIFHRKAHAVSYREATIWVSVWVTLALIFNFALYHYMLFKFTADPQYASLDAATTAKRIALEFLTGYVVEQSLSVDNIFVFVVVFRYFGIPPSLQHRVLFYGILGALIFRGIFISIGSALIRYHWMLWIFGGFLVFTGFKLFSESETEIEPEKNFVIRTFRKWVPVTPLLHGDNFWIKESGKWFATPLLITVLCLEMTDILFAVDSVPAIFAVTREPLVVFTSNIFAILGLRSLYFLLANSVEKFHLLHYGLAIVLIFVGLKMTIFPLLRPGGVPIGISLAFILLVISGSIALSLLYPKKLTEEAAELKPGA